MTDKKIIDPIVTIEEEKSQAQASAPAPLENNGLYFDVFCSALHSKISSAIFSHCEPLPAPIDIKVDTKKNNIIEITTYDKKIYLSNDGNLSIHFPVIEQDTGADTELVKKEKKFLISASTLQVLMYIMECFTLSDRGKTVTIDFNEFYQKRAVKDKKECKNSFLKELFIIRHAWIEYSYMRNNKMVNEDFNIFQKRTVIGVNTFKLLFTDDFYEYILKFRPIKMPSLFYRLNNKTQASECHLIVFLANQKYMNYGKPNDDIFKVTTLLDCAQIALPGDIKNDRHIRRCLDKLEKTLDTFNKYFSYYFIKDKHTLFTQEELETLPASEFLKGEVVIVWKNFPSDGYIKKNQTKNNAIKKAITKKENLKKYLANKKAEREEKRAKGLY